MVLYVIPARGLSPLARGTPAYSNIKRLEARFIPAGAGNTIACGDKFGAQSVYPRWRGEHGRYQRGPGLESGLSPLARGTLSGANQRLHACRFIPAHAGNTSVVVAGTRYWSVYPRSRGEHVGCRGFDFVKRGLSPLTRGTHKAARHEESRPRFIPGHAGNTLQWSSSLMPRAVYPRSRGEHSKWGLPEVVIPGLSPLTRGTRGTLAAPVHPGGFIPAHAGNTARMARVLFTCSVYPRSRGEHSKNNQLNSLYFYTALISTNFQSSKAKINTLILKD